MQEPGVHQISYMEEGPEGLVRLAAECGLDRICLFTHSPLHDDGSRMFPIVEAGQVLSFRRLLQDSGIGITNAEYFPIMTELEITAYLPALDVAAELGAKRIVTHVHEMDEARTAGQLSLLCEAAAERQLLVGLEFTGFAAGCNSLAKALRWQARLARPNLQVAVDALHFFRTGGTLEELRGVDPTIIGYAQLCDGPDLRVCDDYLDEAMHRMIPGEGVFPLAEFLSILPPGVDLDIEVPGMGHARPRERAVQAIAASRQLIKETRTRQ